MNMFLGSDSSVRRPVVSTGLLLCGVLLPGVMLSGLTLAGCTVRCGASGHASAHASGSASGSAGSQSSGSQSSGSQGSGASQMNQGPSSQTIVVQQPGSDTANTGTSSTGSSGTGSMPGSGPTPSPVVPITRCHYTQVDGQLAAGEGMAVPLLDSDIHVVSTFDNSGVVGLYGLEGVTGRTDWVTNRTAAEIFGCGSVEHYRIDASSLAGAQYLFAGMEADLSTSQGALFRVARNGSTPVYSGDKAWEACATGVNLGAANDVRLNELIGQCNLGAEGNTDSKGWVGECASSADGNCVAVGEPNVGNRTRVVGGAPPEAPGNVFPEACRQGPMGVHPRWMIYKAGGTRAGQARDPFVAPGYSKFTLFRLNVSRIPKDGGGPRVVDCEGRLKNL